MEAHRQAAWQLLQESTLRPDDVHSRLQQALSPSYWEELNPSLSVNKDRAGKDIQSSGIDASELDKLAAKLTEEGYFQTEPIISNVAIERMRECVAVLKKSVWPAVFAFVYDDFWQITRIPSVVKLLSSVLGPGYKQLPAIWGHYVNPNGGLGWRPHNDGSNKPNRLTVWIALSDATLESGCMYVIPKNRVPRAITEQFHDIKTISREDLNIVLQSSRALPAHAGVLLGWDHGVIHWGSISEQRSAPRISVSQEFISKQGDPPRYQGPLLDNHCLPPFRQRIQIISRAIVAYQKFEPLMIRFSDLAQELILKTS